MREVKKMKRIIIALILATILTSTLLPTAVLAATGTVTATVTAGTIGVTVDNGNVTYGTLPFDTVKNTAQYDATDNAVGMNTPQTQTITTSGGVAVDINIKTSDAVGSTDWTVGTSRAADQFTHAYNVANTAYSGGNPGPTFTMWTAADTDVTVASGVTDVTRYLELEIGMPTSATDAAAHTITVTVTVVQSSG
jgi:hypothetical protein